MTPRGAKALIAMRQSGRKPVRPVWVSYGQFREPDWDRWAHSQFAPELVVLPADPIDRLDLRCVVGLHVILFLSKYDDKGAELFNRLQEFAREIDLLSPDFDDDIGFHWTQNSGVREYGTPEKRGA